MSGEWVFVSALIVFTVVIELAREVWYYRSLANIYREGYDLERQFSDQWRREAFALMGMDDPLAAPESEDVDG